MLTSENERRTFDRYSYDGAVVRFIKGKNLGILKKFSQNYPMKDISRSGMRFEFDRYKDPGSLMDVIVDIPGESNIHIRGNIQWVMEFDNSQKYEIGILFAPYGHRREYNPFRSKDRLKNMLKKRELH